MTHLKRSLDPAAAFGKQRQLLASDPLARLLFCLCAKREFITYVSPFQAKNELVGLLSGVTNMGAIKS